MASLMSLPRELRDQISFHVIFAEKQPPALNKSFDELISERTVYKPPCLCTWSKIVFSLEDDEIGNASTLLYINRQFRAETLENIRTVVRACEYEIDIIILDEIVPLTTWTYVPFLTTKIDKVTATFRISGSYAREIERRDRRSVANTEEKTKSTAYDMLATTYEGFMIGNGAGPAMQWQIYGILERFLELGPQSDAQHRRSNHGKCEYKSWNNNHDAHKHHPMAVKTLEINIETPPGIEPTRFGPPMTSLLARRDRGRHPDGTVLDPRYLYNFIEQNIVELLSSSSYEWFQYGKVLFEHVDYVVFKLDGMTIENDRHATYDVAAELKHAAYFQERYPIEEELRVYKEWAWKVRKERGLRVLEDCK